MTTKNSPAHMLRAQASKIAAMLKKIERHDFSEVPVVFSKIIAARYNPSVTFAMVMDDKILSVSIEWAIIGELTEAELVTWIVSLMQEKRGQ